MFCLWLLYTLHRQRNKEADSDKNFWKREAAANSTRRKSLDNLDYIQIPFESLPMEILADDPAVAEYHETLRELAKEPIVNFTGISNTDLKLMYGAPNIDILSRYDQRYTVLVRTLQDFAQTLYDNGYVDEASRILEFSVSTRTDISATYKLLATIYREKGETAKISGLIPIAKELNSSLSKHIVSALEEFTLQ